MQVTFEFPETFEVESRDQTVVVPVSQLSAEILSKALGYGFRTAIPDAANNAPRSAAVAAIGDKKKDEKADAYEKRLKAWYQKDENEAAVVAKAVELMQKRIENLLKGVWTVRGTGLSRRDRILDTIVRAAAKASLSKDDWAKFEEFSDDDQSAKVKAWYEANKAKFDTAVDERIAELDRIAAEKRALSNSVAIAL